MMMYVYDSECLHDVPSSMNHIQRSYKTHMYMNMFCFTDIVCFCVQVFPLGNRSLTGSIASGNLRLLLNCFLLLPLYSRYRL